MISIKQQKAVAGTVNLTSDFDNIAINGIKNLSATLKALIFGFQSENVNKAAILQGLEVKINDNMISVSSGAAVTASGEYPFFISQTLTTEISTNGKYVVIHPEIVITDSKSKRIVKMSDSGEYEEHNVSDEQELSYSVIFTDTPKIDDLVLGKWENEKLQSEKEYPVLRLSRTLDRVTDFLDTASVTPSKNSLMMRDENGRAKTETPSASNDIVNKSYVDNAVNNEATARENFDARTDNPHKVTKDQVGLGNCDNTADAKKEVLSATKLKTARKIQIKDNSGNNQGSGVDFDGTENIDILLPAIIKATLDGKANTATSAGKLGLAGKDGWTTTNDTPKNWAAKGTCVWYFTKTNQLNGQPTPYGVMLNLVTSSDIRQLFFTCDSGDGDIYQRGGIQSGKWHTTGWRKIFDSKNLVNATTSTSGLMSTDDKKKLDGIATGANKYSLPTASDKVLGGVKTGDNITNSSGVISVTKDNVTNALGYTPATQNTATTLANGLMSNSDKVYINRLQSVFQWVTNPRESNENCFAARDKDSKTLYFIKW